jgi:predicted GH43/DUF377 family glycosyl hydrolase
VDSSDIVVSASPPTPAQAQLGLLRDQFAMVRADGGPRLVALTGPAGIGKTTVLKAFMRELLADDAKTRPRVGYGTAGHAGDDYATVRWALRSLLENEQRRGRAAVRRTAEVMLTVAPEWLGVVPAIGNLLKAVAITVDAVRRSGQLASLPLADQLIELILKMADDRPVVLLLDDLHWADTNTAGLLFDVGRAVWEASARILVVVAYRSTGRVNNYPISRTVRSLVRYLPTTVAAMGPLDREQTAEIVRQITGIFPSVILSTWLCARTDGNPLFVVELVGTLRQRGFPDYEEWTEPGIREAIDMIERSGDLPESVEAVLSELLDDLTPEERRVLDVCAVLGEPVDPTDLIAVVDLPEPTVRQALRGLCQQRGLLASAEGDMSARYRFSYDLLPDLLLRDLRVDHFDYAEVNRRCADYLERRGDRADFALWERLARHWLEAGRLDCAIAAAHRAVWSSYHNLSVREQGLLLAQRVNRWAAERADPDLAAQSEMVVAEALQSLHRPLPAFDAVRRAEDQAPPGSAAQAHALFFHAGTIAATNPDRGRYDLAQRAAHQLAEIVARPADPPIQGLHVHLLVTALFTVVGQATAAGAWDAAQEALAVATEVDTAAWVRDWGDWSHEVVLLRAGLLFAQRRYLEAVGELRAATRMAEEHANRYWLTASRGRLGIACCYAGQEDEGLAEIKEGLLLEREVLGSPEGVAGLLRLLGEYYLAQNQTLAAAELLILAESLYLEIGADGAEMTARSLGQVRDGYGAEVFDAWRAEFRPERSAWAEYAMLWGFGRFTPHPENPVLTPQGDTWESVAVRSPAPVVQGDAVILLYQAVGLRSDAVTQSAIGLAEGADAIAFTRTLERPVLAATEPWESPQGCEDPRLSRLGNRFVLTYTARADATGQIAAAFSDDLRQWAKSGPLVPADDRMPESARGAVLLAAPVDGRWWMYFGSTRIWAAWTTDPSLSGWHIVRRPVLSPRDRRFDSRSVEPGPPPVLLPEGIVLVYNATNEAHQYAVGQALISLADPTRVLRRSPVPLLAAESRSATGLIHHDDTWLLYYATPVSTIGVAVTTHPRGL